MFHGYLGAILDGLGVTLATAALSLLLACGFGIVGAVAKLSRSRVARALAGLYTTLIRGIPDLVLMLAIFYGGQIGLNQLAEAQGWDYIDVPPFVAGVLTIGFIFGAYFTETFRGALLAVPKGQAEAAAAFGLSRTQTLRRILLPQMLRHALPGVANNWLVLVKATALVSIIGLDDLLFRAQMAASATREPFTFFLLAAVVYLVITTLSVAVLALLERRFSVGVRRVGF